jgi:hypothetical protein
MRRISFDNPFRAKELTRNAFESENFKNSSNHTNQFMREPDGRGRLSGRGSRKQDALRTKWYCIGIQGSDRWAFVIGQFIFYASNE